MKVLVTGSNGLIGSEAVSRFDAAGHQVYGVDNNMRREFFGAAADTAWNLKRALAATRNFKHSDLDIRDRAGVLKLFETEKFELVIHCAAQPSHERSRDIPLVDFDVNAGGTLNLLEATRLFSPEAIFIHMSTNKVYGDSPNRLPLRELPTRWEYADPDHWEGVSENFGIDQSTHSLFGASKTAADILAQEYGRYYGLKVGIFRAGCLTGPAHSAVELHGFLSHLVNVALSNGEYRIFGYKGKQVRDHLHSADVISAFEAFARDPRPSEVYNLGGGRANSASILECIGMLEERLGRKLRWTYVDQARVGDHICYISDLRKLRADYPQWHVSRSLPAMIDELVNALTSRAVASAGA